MADVDQRGSAAGFSYVLTANALWIGQPLYWPLVDESGPVELLAHRVFWTAVFCLAVVTPATRRRAKTLAVARQPRQAAQLVAAGACMTTAWGVYIYAVNSGNVVEAALGLFMAPLSTMLAGVVFFRERLRPAQWASLAVAAGATLVLAVGYGRPPWIALALCGLNAGYAALKKTAAAPALEGFTVECVATSALAASYIGFLLATGEDTVVTSAPGHLGLVAASGLITALPLLALAAALRRLPLAAVGVMQYVNPTGQFLIGVLVRHEAMPASRWTGFALAWASVLIFIVTALRRFRDQARRAERASSTRSSRWTTSRS